MYLKVSDIRLLNIKVIKDGNEIYNGKSEEAPEEIRNLTYKSISFEGVDIIIEV